MSVTVATTPSAPIQSAPVKQPPLSEGTPPEDTAQVPQDTSSPQWAAMARREKALRAQVKAFEEEKKSFSTIKAELDALKAQSTKASQEPDWKARLADDPITALLEAGMTPQQVADRLLSPEAAEQYKLQKVQSDLEKKFGSQIEELKASQKTNETHQYEQAIKQIHTEVTRLVAADPVAYEAIQANGDTAARAVVALVEETFRSEGFLMSVDEAAQAVEEHLAEQAVKLASLNKVKSKLTPPPAPPEAPKTPPPAPAQTHSQTLSNRITQTPVRASSERERTARAIAAFRGELK